ncbi:MAG: MG2 domain-containing protein [Candidatus Caldarchaeum sp.]|nr:MG2 domain-containing protein [Candidatus Caldarchaeum sp.]MCS7137642.1 MG2 domain-containing protein [Candidatus Caldarchaeum sp.]MDW7978751.1 MG2 domain-containing protein [Candidatus Caldarchaeum sp.]MDW8359140.1 MG2 domain-containing protein [Candidatus Caldarchaeum sp.]
MIKAAPALIAALALLATAGAQTPLTPPALVATTDRQVYRQGENVHITVEALDDEMKPEPNVRIILSVTDPRQEALLDIGLRTDLNGTATYTLELPANAPEGEYVVEAYDERNIHRPAAIYFIVCTTCKRAEAARTITRETTATETLTTTVTTTATARTTQTTTITEPVLTNNILLPATLAVITAIFVFQIYAARRLFKQEA